MDFLKDFKRKLEKIETVSVDFAPPRHWYSTGNYAINKILSGSYLKGIPQSRATILAGPSGCLPASETVEVYEMRSSPLGQIPIKQETKKP